MSADTDRVADLEDLVRRIDTERIALERAVRWLESDSRTYRYAIGGIMQHLWSHASLHARDSFPAYVYRMLYPDDQDIGNGRTIKVGPTRRHYCQPDRRWQAFTRTGLAALCEAHGLRHKGRSRKWMLPGP